ncbi:MAG TPA: hypothetical protein DEQ05_02935, partial [Thermodesulfobacterium commune]
LSAEQVEVLKIFSKMSKNKEDLKKVMEKKALTFEDLKILNSLTERFFNYFLVFEFNSLQTLKETFRV